MAAISSSPSLGRDSTLLATWDGTQAQDSIAGNPVPGVEKVSWDPAANRLRVDWRNSALAIPNSMQALSRANSRMYFVSIQGGQWGLSLVNWDNGSVVRFIPMGAVTDNAYNIRASGIQIGPDRSIVTMSPDGVSRFAPG
jgi:hypothetical protein